MGDRVQEKPFVLEGAIGNGKVYFIEVWVSSDICVLACVSCMDSLKNGESRI